MTPIPVGARVHHVGSKYSYGFSENERLANPSDGWGTILSSLYQPDGSFEYQVKKDAPFIPGASVISWWASYHIDRWEMIMEETI
jgi:hypothetical protein